MLLPSNFPLVCRHNRIRDTIDKERRGVAQPGSASALGAEGRGFESLRPDQHPLIELLKLSLLIRIHS